MIAIGATILAYGPAYFANMAPPLAKALQLPGQRPLWERRLGSHKTYRGLVTAVIGGAIAGGLLHYLAFGWYADHTPVVSVATGALVGLAAILGDALKSAVKRALKVPAGQPFVPWDQIDFVLGASLVIVPLGIAPWWMALLALAITPLLHLLVNMGAYLLRMKDVWW